MFDQAIEKVGSKFKLTVLLQKRVRELVAGAQPLIKLEGQQSPINIALNEIMQDKVFFDGEILKRMPLMNRDVEKVSDREEEKPRKLGKLGSKTKKKHKK